MDWAAHAPTENASTDLLWPVDGGRLWRGFGKVRKGKRKKLPHQGIDIGAPDGTPIRAVNDALVIYADNGVRGYGNLMVLVHADASVTFYAHCTSLYFFPGQTVTRGQVIAEVGHTGIARGSHLHFEYRVRGHARDPQPKLTSPTDRPSTTEGPRNVGGAP